MDINCGVLHAIECVEYTLEEFGSEPGGGNRGRGEEDLQGFLPPGFEFFGISGIGVPNKGPHTGQAPGKLYV